MKDYSLYILDPLEDLISKSRHGQSGGVAVGMGLMSTILAIPMKESPSVTGTFVASGGEDDALEVVISLRQVGGSYNYLCGEAKVYVRSIVGDASTICHVRAVFTKKQHATF